MNTRHLLFGLFFSLACLRVCAGGADVRQCNINRAFMNEEWLMLSANGIRESGDFAAYRVEIFVFSVPAAHKAFVESLQKRESVGAADIENMKSRAGVDMLCSLAGLSHDGVAKLGVARDFVRPLFAAANNAESHKIGLEAVFCMVPSPKEGFTDLNMAFAHTLIGGFVETSGDKYPLLTSQVLRFSAPVKTGEIIFLTSEELQNEYGSLALFLRVSRIGAVDGAAS